MVQRHVQSLGESNSSQAAAWRNAIEVLDDDARHKRTLALFPEDRCTAIESETTVVRFRLSDMRLCRPRQWGACWLAGQLWRELQWKLSTVPVTPCSKVVGMVVTCVRN